MEDDDKKRILLTKIVVFWNFMFILVHSYWINFGVFIFVDVITSDGCYIIAIMLMPALYVVYQNSAFPS